MVYRETNTKYNGPYPVIRVDGKQVFILIDDKAVQHSLHQVNLHQDYEGLQNGDKYIDILINTLASFKSDKNVNSNRKQRRKRKKGY